MSSISVLVHTVKVLSYCPLEQSLPFLCKGFIGIFLSVIVNEPLELEFRLRMIVNIE
jgi:hypothetical protein